EDIATPQLEAYLAELKTQRHLAPASRAHMRHVLRSFFHYAIQRNLVNRNPALPIESVKIPQKERAYLSEQKAEALLSRIESPVLQVVCRTLYGTGLRISECLNLTLADVDLEVQVIHVHAGKGGKDRNVPLGDKLIRVLTRYLDQQRPHTHSDTFFVTQQGKALSPQKVNAALHEAAQRLGWPDSVTAHILRHSYASRLLVTGANLVQVQHLLGHSSLAVTGLYTHVSPAELAEAVKRL
ncbi:MAG: tyrosine-type recombinase/integrase, partial [Desulfitobacteriaceae bacterium]|nr:tyrosine-type recombinase/integrase [Desulfitobacteriaceae bacterium]